MDTLSGQKGAGSVLPRSPPGNAAIGNQILGSWEPCCEIAYIGVMPQPGLPLLVHLVVLSSPASWQWVARVPANPNT